MSLFGQDKRIYWQTFCHVEDIAYSEHYEDVVFISLADTIENDRTGRNMTGDERTVKSVDDLSNLDLILGSIVEVQTERLPKKERSDTLLMLGDCLGPLGHRKHRGKLLPSCTEMVRIQGNPFVGSV